MNGVKIFVSHTAKYGELAKSLKLSLHALEEKPLLDIRISEEMTGATDWREWIDANVRTADVFLFLYPHASMDMAWCHYELGIFFDPKGHIVCIKNTDIPEPPPAFQPYVAYDADEAGFATFIEELFVSGTFTDGRPLNSDVTKVASTFYQRAISVETELAKQFAEARVRERFDEWRSALSARYDDAGRFVAANVERPRPLIGWSLPVSMPAKFKLLLQMVRMMFRHRWDILEPRFLEAKYRAPSTERCFEIARSVIADCDQMQRDAENEGGARGLDDFYSTFHRTLRAEVDACGKEWMQLTELMRATPANNPEELSRQLKDLLGNNARWLTVAGKQFMLTVAAFG